MNALRLTSQEHLGYASGHPSGFYSTAKDLFLWSEFFCAGGDGGIRTLGTGIPRTAV